ncbi:MAG: hypothetical protein OXB98_00265 [Bryobacterales bacterium]|nr:hypothetical protein [Bryobacterales bacterium]
MDLDCNAVEGKGNRDFAGSFSLLELDGLDQKPQALSRAAAHEGEAGFMLVPGHDLEGAAVAAKSGLAAAATVGCGSRRVSGCDAADRPAGRVVREIMFGHGARSVLAVVGLEAGVSRSANSVSCGEIGAGGEAWRS